MGRGLKREPSSNKPASDSTPGGMKVMDPAPGHGKVREIKGPSIKGSNAGPESAPYHDKTTPSQSK